MASPHDGPLGSLALHANIARGSAWSLGTQAVVLLVTFGVTPFLIRNLGPERYGAFVLIQLILVYFAISDAGMGDASTRFASSAHSLRDGVGEARAVWTALSISAVAVMIAAVLLLLVSPVLVSTLVPEQLRAEATTAIAIAVVVLAARAFAGVLKSPQIARLRFATFSLISGGAIAIQTVMLPIAVAVDPSLDTAALVLAGSAVAVVAAQWTASVRMLPQLKHFGFDRGLARRLLRFGAPTIGLTLVGAALMNSEKLWLARFGSLGDLAYYSVAFTIARLTAILPGAVAQSLLPALTRLATMDDQSLLRAVYARSVRLLVLSLAPAAAILCLIAEPFLWVWAGPDYAHVSALPLYILSVAMVVDGASYVPRTLLAGMGMPGTILRYQLLNVAPYLVLGAVLTSQYGAAGAAAAWSIRAVAEAAMIFWHVDRWFARGGEPIRPRLGRYAAATLILAGPGVIAAAIGAPAPLIGFAGVTGACAYGVLALADLAVESERAVVLRSLPTIGRRGRPRR